MIRTFVDRRSLVVGAIALLAWCLNTACAQPPAPAPPPEQAIAGADRPQVLRVVDPAGDPVAGALVYVNTCSGQGRDCAPLVTDQQGQVVLDPASEVVAPIALALQDTKTAGQDDTCCENGLSIPCRAAQGSWSYAVYLTNLSWSDQGDPLPVQRAQEDVIELPLQRLHPLILYNLVVSLEWPASEEYLNILESALRSASDYLFDLTDGQMAFGELTIYDDSQHWAEADLRVHRSNTVCPFATIGVLTGLASSGAIELSPYWDGDFVTGPWTKPDGFRTIAHEFLHYAAGLYDEYVDDNGDSAYCPQPLDQLPCADDDRLSASAMFHEECTSELSAQDVAGLWSPACKNTRHWQRTQRSAWEVVKENYDDSCQMPPRWRIETPQDRGGPMAGPDPRVGQWPPALPHWPVVNIHRQPVPAMPDLRITFTSPCSAAKANVTLYPGGRDPGIALGEAALRQDFLLLGAQPGDWLCAETQDHACADTHHITQADWISTPTVDLSSTGCDTDAFAAANAMPSWTEHVGELTRPLSTTIAPPSYVPGQINVAAVGIERVSPALPYNLASGAQGITELLQDELYPSDLPDIVDYGQVMAVDPTSDRSAEALGWPLGAYAIQQFGADGSNEMFSADGRLRLTQGLAGAGQETGAAIIYQPRRLPPAPLPANARLVSEIAYATPAESASDAEQLAVLEARCIPRPQAIDTEAGRQVAYQLLRLDEASGQWEAQDAEFVDAANLLTALISRPGYYAFVEIDE